MNNLVHLRLINGNHLNSTNMEPLLSYLLKLDLQLVRDTSYRIGTNTFTKNKTVARHEINTAPIRASIA